MSAVYDTTKYPLLRPDFPCAKCGATGAAIKYVPRERLCGEPTVVFPERMIRTCARCGFEWTESVIGEVAS